MVFAYNDSGAGCFPGANLVSETYLKGCGCSIGFTNYLSPGITAQFLRSFSTALGYGYTISQAMAFADNAVLYTYGYYGGTNYRLVLGTTSTSFTIYTPITSAEDPVSSDGLMYSSGSGSVNTKGQILSEISDDYSVIDSYYTEETGLLTTRYNKLIDGYKTEDYAYTMVDVNGNLCYAGVPNPHCLDGFKVTEQFISSCEKQLSSLLEGKDYSITEYMITGSCDAPGMRYYVTVNTEDELQMLTVEVKGGVE